MAFFLSAPLVAQEAATLRVSPQKVLNPFIPFNAFGNNVASWADPRPVQKKVQAAGNFLLRFPGGSWGDVYHWNGEGKYDARGIWVPSASTYKPGHLVKDYQPNFSAVRVHDNDLRTCWRSDPESDYPHFQWILLDLGSVRSADAVTVTWGDAADKSNPIPGKFAVQYWDPSSPRGWMPYSGPEDAWLEASKIKNNRVKGGVQGLSFPAVKARYLRLVLRENPAGYSVAETKVFAGGKEAPLSDMKAVASSTHRASTLEGKPLDFHFEGFMGFVGSFAPKAEPLIIVNFGTGTPQEAAAWVQYANKVRGYGIKYWELGNEMEAHWEGGGPSNARDYAKRYILFYEAMKAVDPSIVILGCANGPESSSGLYDGQSYIESFVNRLALEGKAHYLEGLTLHDYPQWGQKAQDLLDSVPTRWDSMAATVWAQLVKHPQGERIPVMLTEFNTSDHVDPDISVRLENGLWLSQYLLEFLKHFGTRGYTMTWNIMNGGNAIKDPKGGDHGYLQAEPGPYQYQERADYWTMWMLTNHWALPGDKREHKMVATDSSQARLVPYADLRPDGSLSLLVVNKDPARDFKTTITLEGFQASDKAQGHRFDATNYRWNTASAPYHADPNLPPTAFELSGPSFQATFPKYSLTVLRFTPKP